MVEFTSLALQDITFALCAKRVPLKEFKILGYAEIEIGRQFGGRVTIIGQSHVWQISNGKDVLAEILLCVPHDLTAFKPICQTASLSNFRLD